MVIAAVVLAAGQSKRMGEPKLVLPWGEQTIIAKVVSSLVEAGVPEIVVVTGGAHEAVVEALHQSDVRIAYNPNHENDDMVRSLSIGLDHLPKTTRAAFVVLGDQPQILPETVTRMMDIYQRDQPQIVIPSYQNRRGHPWLLDRQLWQSVRDLLPDETLRDFLHRNSAAIHYLIVGNSTVISDIDTPGDYLKAIGTP